MTSVTVCVVIPAYNEALTIVRSLQAISSQTVSPDLIIVVDNGSTDGTADVIRTSFPDVVVLHEPRKGTGFACNTGFNAAIASGADIIMRTDADTSPRPDWVHTTREYLAANTQKMIVGGQSKSLRDEYYRRRDEVVMPLVVSSIRYGGTVIKKHPAVSRLAFGCNLAVRSEAFQAVGGFPDSTIDSTDEDLVLTIRMHEEYGYNAIGVNPNMIVETSARRLRKLGFIGILRYYARDSQGAREFRSRMLNGDIDIR